jgi:hypothetical protein
MDQSIELRFWAKVNVAGTHQVHMPTCCWEWQGATNNDGYGRFRVNGKLERAHALSLSWTLGYIPKYVMHQCDNPACVRPSHLQEGTHGLNMRDAYKKQRRPDCTPKGINHYSARFTVEQVQDIRARYTKGETQAHIGADYGVCQAHISQIVRRQTYSSVPEAKIGNSWDQAK